MSRFQTIEDVRTFCRSVAQLAVALGDEEIGLMLRKALAAGDTSSPTERLGETILGLEAARRSWMPAIRLMSWPNSMKPSGWDGKE